jgi:hypothetical protein
MRKVIFFVTVLSFYWITNFAFGANLITRDTFEEGPSWKYSTHWDLYNSYLSDEWKIVTKSPKSGKYCAESKAPGGTMMLEDSTFIHSLPTNENEIFIRFWFKASSNMSVWWAQFMRFYGASGNGDLEIGMGVDGGTGDTRINTGNINVFGTLYPLSTGWGDYQASKSWTEFAIYINYASNKLYFWKNAKSYTKNDSSFKSLNVSWQGKYNKVVLPIYYKRSIEDGGSYLFWLDDIEIWNGIPDGPLPNDPALPSAPTGLRVIE